jgi:hypothetical protein
MANEHIYTITQHTLPDSNPPYSKGDIGNALAKRIGP